MRGTPIGIVHRKTPTGIIPAYAGNTGNIVFPFVSNWDHPRVCGEHYGMFGISYQSMRIIPAYAGNTCDLDVHCFLLGDHPRVCGEHDDDMVVTSPMEGSSPRMRGTPTALDGDVDDEWIIPAYAGNTLRDYSNFVVSKFMSFVFHLV